MTDHQMPKADTLESGASFIQNQVDRGKTVLAHCLAGEGRTGCVLAAYLIKDRRVGAAEALKILRKVKPAFVESSQESAVFAYGDGLS